MRQGQFRVGFFVLLEKIEDIEHHVVTIDESLTRIYTLLHLINSVSSRNPKKTYIPRICFKVFYLT